MMETRYDAINLYITGQILLIQMEDGTTDYVHTGGAFISIPRTALDAFQRLDTATYQIGHYTVDILRFHLHDDAYLGRVRDYV